MLILDKIIDFLFPVSCLDCKEKGVWLCDECLGKIAVRKDDECFVCKKNAHWGITHNSCRKKTKIDGVVIAANWNNPLLKTVVKKFKYNFVRDLAMPLSHLILTKIEEREDWLEWLQNNLLVQDSGLNRASWSNGEEEDGLNDDEIKKRQGSMRSIEPAHKSIEPTSFSLEPTDVIIAPIPLHWRRKNWRGFNQAELLAEKIAEPLELELIPDLLIRRRKTKPQVKKKSRQKRLKSLQGAFALNKKYTGKIKNATILLVDDIITTGTTMEECAKVLKKNKAGKVWGVAVGRG